jgi:hypothetical protein
LPTARPAPIVETPYDNDIVAFDCEEYSIRKSPQGCSTNVTMGPGICEWMLFDSDKRRVHGA